MDGYEPEIDLAGLGLQPPNPNLTPSQIARQRIKERIMLSLNLKPDVAMPQDTADETFVQEIANVLVILAESLKLPLGTLLSALAYLQMYRRASKKWGFACTESGVTPQVDEKKYTRDDLYLTAGACILLAWKTMEDTLGPGRSARKLFELLSILYKMSSGVGGAHVSVSSWILHDASKEAKDLKARLIEHETRLLHAIEYSIGPLALPHVLLAGLTRRFAAIQWQDLHLKQQECQDLETSAGALLVQVFKSDLCLDYGPQELACACIVKAAACLSYGHEEGVKLEEFQAHVLQLLSVANVKADVLSQLLFQLEALPFSSFFEAAAPTTSSVRF